MNKKSSQNTDVNAKNETENELDKDLLKKIDAFHRAHKSLVMKLVGSSSDILYIAATLHSVHSVSMKYENDVIRILINELEIAKRNVQKGGE